jgi:hypothetical protein
MLLAYVWQHRPQTMLLRHPLQKGQRLLRREFKDAE